MHLHWRLLLKRRRLPDPDTPLKEKLDTLAWALTDPALDDRPFSFANCLRVVGTSPLSPTAYFGAVQIDEVRDWLRANANEWIRATVAKCPDWVQTLVRKQPDWIAKQLSRNPQWLNEQIKARQFGNASRRLIRVAGMRRSFLFFAASRPQLQRRTSWLRPTQAHARVDQARGSTHPERPRLAREGKRNHDQ